MRRIVSCARGELVGNVPWTGSVLSQHPRALNILREDGLVVSVVADPMSMSAMGILAIELFELPPDLKLVDMIVQMKNGVISIDKFASINCAECPIWEGRVGAAAVRRIYVEMNHAIRDGLFIHGKPGGLLGVLREGVADDSFVKRALKFLQDGRPEELVGYGPGLTPAGDDFLTGVLLASSARVVLDQKQIVSVLTGTTPVGRTLLWMAMKGRFPAYLVEFIDAMGTAVSDVDISDAVRAACAHGETSGTDALAGFCWQMLNSTNLTR